MTPHQKAIMAAATAYADRQNRDDVGGADIASVSVVVRAYLSTMREMGWKMTPDEATTSMVDAAFANPLCFNYPTFVSIWRAMHRAAPEPE